MTSFRESGLVADVALEFAEGGCLHGIFGVVDGVVDGGDGKDVSNTIMPSDSTSIGCSIASAL